MVTALTPSNQGTSLRGSRLGMRRVQCWGRCSCPVSNRGHRIAPTLEIAPSTRLHNIVQSPLSSKKDLTEWRKMLRRHFSQLSTRICGGQEPICQPCRRKDTRCGVVKSSPSQKLTRGMIMTGSHTLCLSNCLQSKAAPIVHCNQSFISHQWPRKRPYLGRLVLDSQPSFHRPLPTWPLTDHKPAATMSAVSVPVENKTPPWNVSPPWNKWWCTHYICRQKRFSKFQKLPSRSFVIQSDAFGIIIFTER